MWIEILKGRGAFLHAIVNFLLQLEDNELKDLACKYDVKRHSNVDPNFAQVWGSQGNVTLFMCFFVFEY